MLIITTVNDLSLPLFLTQKIQKKLKIDFCFFHENTREIKEKLTSNKYNYIYIRDPFNDIFDKKNIEEKLNIIIRNQKDSNIVDNLKKIGDIYLEDKWRQYQLFSEFMPKTKILKNIKDVDNTSFIAKKRISSRARGIVFDSKDLIDNKLSDYIVQNKIKIDKEYRIYVIFNEIVKEGMIKSSKTENSRVRIIGAEKISSKMADFVKNIIKKNKFDFIGLDIVQSGDSLYLLEINRSCLFNGYFRITGINLAEMFVDKLLEKNSLSCHTAYLASI